MQASTLQTRKSDVVALLCADLHLCEKAPLVRSCEEDWLGVLAGYLAQVNALAAKHGVPVICAGDVFDSWKASPALISFALRHLPQMYSVPGNHDLPHHSYADIGKSAYWTLVEARKVSNLVHGAKWPVGPLVLYGCPYGFPIQKSFKEEHDLALHVLVLHKYIWTKNTGYVGASEDSRLTKFKEEFTSYDVVVIGDNHKPFLKKLDGTYVINVGNLFRRRSDERDYMPSVGLLYSSGEVRREYLDVSKDKLLEAEEAVKKAEEAVDLSGFLSELGSLEECSLDFKEAVRREVRRLKLERGVEEVILRALEVRG